jgi:abortive infection bacteriophage resistance protein
MVGHFIFRVILVEGDKNVKPATTFEEQVNIFRKRGLIITNEQQAIHILSRVNYYRLSAYTLSLKNGDIYNKGVTFNDLYRLYEFDKRLRHLLMEHLESIEILFRTHVAYLIAHKYGPLGYWDKENFNKEGYHSTFLKKLKKDLDNKGELFILHHQNKYDGQFPIWVTTEVMSFGTLSKFFFNMKAEDKKVIAAKYQVHHSLLTSWVDVLSYVRNLCAHYSRLYNKLLVRKLKLDKQILGSVKNNTIFSSIFVMIKLLEYDESMTFITVLRVLMEEYADVIELQRLGFPDNWLEILNPHY